MDRMHNVATTSTSSGLDISIIIEIAGIAVGIFAVVLILRTLGKVGGQVGTAFTLALIGVIFQMTALALNVLVDGFKVLSLGDIPTHNIHEGLMVVGIIFFVLAARQFAKVSQ